MDSNSISTVIGTDTTVTIEIIKALPMVFASIAAIVASIVAIYGINTWRREFIGKRRIELAEDVLALFYQARDAIASIRNPLTMGDELSAPPKENEPIEEKEARDKMYFIFKRCKDREELFSKLSSVRYRFMAQIGPDKVGPFDEIVGTVNEILIFARMSAYAWAKCLKSHNPKRQEAYHEEIRKYAAKIYWGGEEDEITKRVDKAVSEMDTICKGVIMGKSTKQES